MSWIGDIQRFASTVSVWFLRGRNVGTLLESAGLTLDSARETLRQGLALSRPFDCDRAVLPTLASDRGIRLYASEPEASQRARLAQSKQLRRLFGTQQGELRNVQPFFLGFPAVPTIRIVHQAGDGSSATWHTLAPDGTYSVVRATPSNWDWDTAPSKWSRVWCIIDVSVLGLSAQSDWDGGQNWDGGTVWDGLLGADAIADLVAGLTEAKAAHEAVWGLIFATDPSTFSPTSTPASAGGGRTTLPTGNWGFVVDPVTGLPTRLPSAYFAYDRGPG